MDTKSFAHSVKPVLNQSTWGCMVAQEMCTDSMPGYEWQNPWSRSNSRDIRHLPLARMAPCFGRSYAIHALNSLPNYWIVGLMPSSTNIRITLMMPLHIRYASMIKNGSLQMHWSNTLSQEACVTHLWILRQGRKTIPLILHLVFVIHSRMAGLRPILKEPILCMLNLFVTSCQAFWYTWLMGSLRGLWWGGIGIMWRRAQHNRRIRI